MGVNPPGAAVAPVIVTDGETRTALACVRSLGARGVPVHVLAARPPGLAGASRFAAAAHAVPDAAREPEGWARAVVALAGALPGALLLPVTEIAMGTAYAWDLARHLPVAAPPRAAYDLAVDKHALLARAAACGLDVPHGTLVEAPRALHALPEGHRYPVILKARRSRWLEGGRWRHGAAVLVRDDGELRAAVGHPGFDGGLLVQEFVPGHGEGVFLLAHHGATRVRFAHRRLREKPPSGGVSVL
jgi:predicted ATP-grasp superfamily ATP-dependent carboligase